ncbi:hypothetical protein ABZS94_39145 [Streptomyces sp. NPDC005500]|uniref:hypothetical protein n=1 Tax=Streptomyces sp. NPDC005500 TaxID=3155007 RepID=UPI0033BEB4FC
MLDESLVLSRSDADLLDLAAPIMPQGKSAKSFSPTGPPVAARAEKVDEAAHSRASLALNDAW